MTIREAFRATLGTKARFDVPLAPHATLRVGGAADIFVTPESLRDVEATLALARRFRLPLFVLGRGSNLVFSDRGFRGVVLSFQEGFRGFHLLPDGVTLEAAAGVPGTVGGACFMNAGTHEGSIGEVVERVEWIDHTGMRSRLERDRLAFSYRRLALPREGIILKAWLRLRPAPREEIAERIERILEARRMRQPLDLPNAGSIFKNPPGDFAGRLIEAAGLKGRRIGDAQISTKHANFIVNRGAAASAEIVALIDLVRREVFAASGVALEPEVKVIGERGPHDG